MNTVSLDLETAIRSWAVSAKALKSAADDVLSQYFATDASGLVEGLSSASTPATVSTALTKAELQNMIGAIQQLQKFFSNQDVTTGDYLNSLENVLHGSNPASSVLSNDVENIGEDEKALANQMIGLYYSAKDIVAAYNSSELGTAVTAISSTVIVFGSSTTKTKYLQGIVLVDQFAKYVGNAAVTTGDYYASVLAWAS
jgi:hypothetical protein